MVVILLLLGRTLSSKLSDDMKSRIAQCQKSCNDLKQKLGARVTIGTNLDVKEIKGDIDRNNAKVESTLKIIKDDQLVKDIFRWLSAPDSSKNYNETREKHQKDTCSWFLNGTRFRDLQENGGFVCIKGTAGSGKTILW